MYISKKNLENTKQYKEKIKKHLTSHLKDNNLIFWLEYKIGITLYVVYFLLHILLVYHEQFLLSVNTLTVYDLND